MDTTPFFPLPSTLRIDRIEQGAHLLTVHLQATSLTVACPQCGTPGSRVPSRYLRTVADVACVGQHVVLNLRVRKWVCARASCPHRIFAERFPGLVQRYARMTDRLIQMMQAVGITTNGADGARLLSRRSIPTTGETIIRRVLELPLRKEGPVPVAGVDEWVWKKGARSGTILVDLQQRRIAALLAERSVETSTAWFKTHPEVDIVARDRGKLFRQAIAAGAPQAKHVVDRFPLQQHFAEALELFFGHPKQLLKKAAQQLVGKPLPAHRPDTTPPLEQERRRRHAARVRRHQKIWKLFRAGYSKEAIAQRVGIASRSVYRALSHEQPPARQRRHRTHHVPDPYLAYLSDRWNQGCHSAIQLYEEVVAQRYLGSLRSIERIVGAFRPQGTKPVNRRTITLRQAPSARSAALMIVRSAEHRTQDQTAFIDQLCKTDPKVATAFTLAQAFGQLLRKLEGKRRLDQWKAAVRASGITGLVRFVDGLDDDADAVANGCSESWSNGMVEGFLNKVKGIKRSSYGQAGFPLLQRRVLLHPATRDRFDAEQKRRSSPRSPAAAHDRTSGTGLPSTTVAAA
jgi:transposase